MPLTSKSIRGTESRATSLKNPKNNDNCEFSGESLPRAVSETSVPSEVSFEDDIGAHVDLFGHIFAESPKTKNNDSMSSGTISTATSRSNFVNQQSSVGQQDSSSLVAASNTETLPSSGWHDVSYTADTSLELGLEVNTDCHVVLKVKKGTQADEMGILPQSRLRSLDHKPITPNQPLAVLWRRANKRRAILVVSQPPERVINGDASQNGELQDVNSVEGTTLDSPNGNPTDEQLTLYGTNGGPIGKRTFEGRDCVSLKKGFGASHANEEPASSIQESDEVSDSNESTTQTHSTWDSEVADDASSDDSSSSESSTLQELAPMPSSSDDSEQNDRPDDIEEVAPGPNIEAAPSEHNGNSDKLKHVKQITFTKEKVIGSRVYAQWEKNSAEGWHWGIITNRKRVKTRGRGQYMYSVLFDDGDFLEEVGCEQVWSVPSYRHAYRNAQQLELRQPPPLPRHAVIAGLCDPYHVARAPSRGCSEAESEKKRSKTESRHTTSAISRDHSKAESEKMRRTKVVGSIKGALTPEELFRNRCKECLLCQKQDCLKCATCVRNQNRTDEGKEVCLQKMCCNIDLKQKAQPAEGFPPLWTFAIGQPREAAKNKDSPLAGLFLITPKGRVYRSLSSASARNHQERELSKYPRLVEMFFKHIGVPYEPGRPIEHSNHSVNGAVSKSSKSFESTGSSQRNKRKRDSAAMAGHNASSNVQKRQKRNTHTPGPAYTPEDLYNARCKNCILCLKEDCLKCATCIRNQSHKGEKGIEVCLRKMCSNIKNVDQKAQEAVGFPKGWRFIFDKPKRDYYPHAMHDQNSALEGLLLLAPNGRRYKAVDRAINHNRKSLGGYEGLAQAFYAHVGATYSEEDPHHHLVGTGICQEWTDVEGRNRIVYGVVSSGCEIDPQAGGDVLVNVEYSEESRADTNSIPSVCGSVVPKSQTIKHSLALGACAFFAEKMDCHNKAVVSQLDLMAPRWTWLTPEWRHEEFLDVGHGIGLPRLTITLRAFRLVFTVKESTIPDAGYGVFVTATQLVKTGNGQDAENFRLKVGEFLDLGVYAPFRAEDKKRERVFFMKNYVHNFKCEEWGFDTKDEDFMFDITNDLTGNVHELARRHIPSYVNECKKNEIATIRAEHDPCGNVHYLLGVVEGESLILPGNGAETELFINYGPGYEPVRIRKGYSELPEDVKAKKLLELNQEGEQYLKEIEDCFTLDEVGACIDFFLDMFMKDGKEDLFAADTFGVRAGRRAMRVSRYLEERAKSLKRSGEHVPQALLTSAKLLVSLLERLFGKGSLRWRSNAKKHGVGSAIISE